MRTVWNCLGGQRGLKGGWGRGNRKLGGVCLQMIHTCMKTFHYLKKKNFINSVELFPFGRRVCPGCTALTRLHRKVISRVQLFRLWETTAAAVYGPGNQLSWKLLLQGCRNVPQKLDVKLQGLYWLGSSLAFDPSFLGSPFPSGSV